MKMIKEKSEWSFTEWQSYAKGYLEGIIIGIVIAINIGTIIYLLVH